MRLRNADGLSVIDVYAEKSAHSFGEIVHYKCSSQHAETCAR
jgi:hypothetical protein